MNPDDKADSRGASGRPVPPGAVLCVKTGYFEGLEVPVDRIRLVIGRGRVADFSIPEPTMSRAHAAIGFDGEVFFVEDLGSTNGTLVNGGHTQRQVLKSGDDVQMGRLVVGVTLPD